MAAGVLIIIMGLNFLGVLRIGLLFREARFRAGGTGLGGAFVMGLAFAFGWTPCIGPILGAILLYASQQETVGQGVALLSAYSLGLGLPFVLSGLAVNRFFVASARVKRHMRAVEWVSGGLLVAVGLLLVTDRLTLLALYIARLFPALTRIG